MKKPKRAQIKRESGSYIYTSVCFHDNIYITPKYCSLKEDMYSKLQTMGIGYSLDAHVCSQKDMHELQLSFFSMVISATTPSYRHPLWTLNTSIQCGNNTLCLHHERVRKFVEGGGACHELQ